MHNKIRFISAYQEQKGLSFPGLIKVSIPLELEHVQLNVINCAWITFDVKVLIQWYGIATFCPLNSNPDNVSIHFRKFVAYGKLEMLWSIVQFNKIISMKLAISGELVQRHLVNIPRCFTIVCIINLTVIFTK